MGQGNQHHSDDKGTPYVLLLYIQSCCNTESVAEVSVIEVHIQKVVGPVPRAPTKPMRSPKKGMEQAIKAMSTT